MDVTSLKAVLAEWRPTLLPSRFEKAQQPSRDCLQIGLRTLEGSQWLEISWQADAARMHIITAPPREGDGSTLAQQLQHSLRGLALTSLEQQGWERIVELGFSERPGEPIARWLVVELMGRHSNLFLLDGQRQVIALARQVKTHQSRLRPIGTGDAYQSPPALMGEPPNHHEGQESWQRRLSLLPLPLGKALGNAYQGISPALMRQLVGAELRERPVGDLKVEQWLQLWRQWQHWLTCLSTGNFVWQCDGDSYRCWPPLEKPWEQGATSINSGLGAYYAAHLEQLKVLQARQQLQLRLEQAAQRERQLAAQQQALLAAVPQSDGLQGQADALLSQLSPSRACIASAQKLYNRARKLRRSVAAITPRLELHHQRLEWLEASLTFLENASTSLELAALGAELEGPLAGKGSSSSRRRRPSPSGQPVPLLLRSPSGIPVQVGRNHRQNEWIALKQARRGDLWFHAQELPGSHVVLKASEGLAGEADLQAAADLAAHFSRGRGSSQVPVVMVPTSDLQRIPGAAEGTVRHRQGEVLWGEPDRALSLLAAGQP
ncbi:NFACT family protein [Cyanobium sp. HWJ4-Hawea]|uniref:Rqc2 family fibronectin-binding protein n=1 Tax=Cyanobium sp. HWJ4-Hawea TaxID=2823713 RepID=UPI0020CC4D01|nr:NFACT RNA binding domain-containing protein [Cyanobium sp. HWJ4-Hawea]MCP9809225.1 NFACT family protein [Cyanobium sp. HWJ4-Hawea]